MPRNSGRGNQVPASGGSQAASSPQVAVIETSAERAATLARLPYLYVEPDQRLGQGAMRGLGTGALAVAPPGDLQQVTVRVTHDSGRPVEDAAVCLTGHGLPAIGFTSADGTAELTVAAETAAAPEALWVRPARGCWPARVVRPQVTAGQPVVAVCERIVTTFPQFPEQALLSWGSRAMGFDRLPPTYRGAGIRIVLISSGAADGHPDLSDRLADGRDMVGQDDKSWQQDPIGIGTHLAVLIAGRDNGTGVTGLAPEVELHVCRTAPGGHLADLIEALDYCISEQADIAVLTDVVALPSSLLAAKVHEARMHGVACIAAVGDGSGPIRYPAALPGVLAVGAVGHLGTFPPGTGLVNQIIGPPSADGYFAPRFANYGPGIDCCAPGVAIVSGLPPASYGPLDGTAVAAAHVAATAALLLAHHPHFRAVPGGMRTVDDVRDIRDTSRTDRLFRMILAACRPVPGLDQWHTGRGMPDVAVAVGLLLSGTPTTPIGLGAPEEFVHDPFRPVEAAMRAAGLLEAPAHAELREDRTEGQAPYGGHRKPPAAAPGGAYSPSALAAARAAAGTAPAMRDSAASSCAAETNHASNADGGR